VRQFKSELHHCGVIHSAHALLGAHADFHNHVVYRLSNSDPGHPEGRREQEENRIERWWSCGRATREPLSVPRDLLAMLR
jgi:hypothetical protein